MKMTWNLEFVYVCILTLTHMPLKTGGQCTLPLSDGTWLSSTRGTWTVSGGGTQVSNFEADLTVSLSAATLNCTQAGGTSSQYVLSTYFEIFRGLFITVYTCLEVTLIQAPNSYVAYIVTPTDTSTGEKFTSDVTGVCSNTAYRQPTNVMMLLKSGTESNVTTNCNDVILGNYSVTYTDSDSAVTSDIRMDSCADTTKLTFDNVTAGNNLAFTSGNVLQCLYATSSGSNVYLFTYNGDASVDSTTTYRFTCWVLAYSSGGTRGTVHPESCLSEQSTSSVAYPGQQFMFAPYYVCPLNPAAADDDSGLAGWAIALIVLSCLLALVVAGVIIGYLLMRRQKRRDEAEKGIGKDRQPSPDSIPDEDSYMNRLIRKLKDDHAITDPRDPKYRSFRKKEDGYDSGFDERGQLKDKVVREKSFELHEIKKGKGKTLISGKPFTKKTTDPIVSGTAKKQPQPEPGDKMGQPLGLDAESDLLPTPRGSPRPVGDEMILEKIRRGREKKEKEKEEKKRQKEIKKAKLKDEKQKEGESEKEQPVIKTIREDSASDEYETDESEQERRRKRLLEKKQRLQAASYVPPEGVTDATVVGRKKQRHRGEEGDIGGHLVSRDEQEKQDKRRKSRTKAMRSLAKRKLRPSSGQSHSSDSDSDAAAKRHKRRRGGGKGARERGAPFMEQYNVKKGLERELEDMDYWHEHAQEPDAPEEDLTLCDVTRLAPLLSVAPAETTDNTPRTKTGDVTIPDGVTRHDTVTKPDDVMRSDDVTQRETVTQQGDASVWERPLPELEIEIGENGQLPEGYYKDNHGNIVRESDGAIIATADVVRLIEMRKRMNVFGLPRLIRNTEGRPLGGYKDDIFGPWAEWDWGEMSEDAKSEAQQRAASSKQVGFMDDTSVPATPLTEYDYNRLKGRQLGSAERELLQQRLFEQQQRKMKADNTEGDKRLPVFRRPCGRAESVYLENSEVQRLDASQTRRSKSLRAAPQGGSTMVMRSDTFDDGRSAAKENRKQQSMKRNTKLRASWGASDSFVRDGIPEEAELEDTEAAAPKASGMNRNLGSDDEFVFVGIGNKGQGQRRDRFGYPPAREETLMSDVSMRTAPDSTRPFSGGDDRRYRLWLGELYKDQKYFEYYLDTEHLPTKAAKETRGLASHGLDFLDERAEFWAYHAPPPGGAPPSHSELALPLSRMQTLYTIADSGMDSAVSSELVRPHSADDVDGTMTSARLSNHEHTREMTGRTLTLPSHRSDVTQPSLGTTTNRQPPTGRSEPAKSPSKLEKGPPKEKHEDVNSDSRDNPRKPKAEKRPKTAMTRAGRDTVLTVQQLDQDI